MTQNIPVMPTHSPATRQRPGNQAVSLGRGTPLRQLGQATVSRLTVRACALALAVMVGTPVAASTRPPEALIGEAMRRWEVPGIAYAVFEDGAIGAVAGFGLRDAERRLPVTRRTVFALGSISKSFTVALLSRLAEAGRMDWNAPPSRYIEGFRFGPAPIPATAGRPIAVRDLVSHAAGMPRHDALWYLEAYSGTELAARLRHLRRFAAPGKAFEYSNLLVMLAGRVARGITGVSWARSVARGLTRQLGMNRVRFGYREFLAPGIERARGYYPGDDGRIDIAVRDTDPIAPAAALYADIDDAARWLAMLAGRGRLDGRRVLSAASVAAMWAPRTIALSAASSPALGPVRYGMGFYLTTYRGRKLAYHPGVIDGYAALIAILPDTGFGIIVLTNRSGANPVPAVIAYAALDRHLGEVPLDWMGRYPSAAARRARDAARRLRRDAETARQRRELVVAAPIAASKFAGTYVHPAYGPITFAPIGAHRLAGRMHGRDFVLERWGRCRWRLTETHWPLREGLIFEFVAGEGTKMGSVSAPIADGPTYRHNPGPLRFDRIP